ncbi:hypothetical protein BS47DRAFT_1391482 [Hydnum rufescens UP504]|uniref:Glutamine amidotransferase domain-containing protein n=1 Tax=Hydnum rufescens UP504 TaxID=1448309 RepID=A0A9P6DVS9_9AGAM|nr:hypothetical protein BS47DRAFT_1391482 [Hydnum rufescens UP504]
MFRILIAVATMLNDRRSDKCAPHRNLYSLVWALSRPHPYFGICIGMQVLFASSTEPPSMDGLGIVDSPIGLFNNAGKPVPSYGAHEHVETGEDETYDFVHSYPAPYLPSRNSDWVHTTTQYGRQPFLSTVRRGNVSACQFHPEKSDKTDLGVLQLWLEAPANTVDAEFTKRIIACMDIRANDEGDLGITKGRQYNDECKCFDQWARDRHSPTCKVRNLGQLVTLALWYCESGADEVC